MQELWIRTFIKQVLLLILLQQLLPTTKVIPTVKARRTKVIPKENLVLLEAGKLPVQVIDGQTTVRII